MRNIKADAAQPLESTGKIFLYGNYLFVNEINKGVHIIDNSNPAAPINKHFLSIPGNLDLAVKGHTLYADIYTELLVIDISDPDNPVVKKSFPNVFPEREYSGNFSPDSSMYIVDWLKHESTTSAEVDNNNIMVQRGIWLDFSEQAVKANFSSNAASVITGISGSMARFTIAKDFLYTVGRSYLNAFDISNSQEPVLTNTKSIGWNIETIYPLKDKLFIGSQTGMQVFSIDNPADPAWVSNFEHACYNDPVIANDTHAFVRLRAIAGQSSCWFGTPQNNEMNIVDITDITRPSLVKVYEMEEPKGLSIDGNNLFLCDGKGGLKIYDVSNVSQINLRTKFTDINPFDIITSDGLCIVVCDEGIYQYDYHNINNISLLSKISIQ